MRKAFFGALLVHSCLQIGMIQCVLSYSKHMKRGEYKQSRMNFSKPPPLIRTNGSIEVPIWNGTPPVVSPKGRLSRHCHCSRGKTLKKRKQKVNTEEKLTLALDRNCLILLGKLPLRQIVIKLRKWLLKVGSLLSRHIELIG